VASSNIDGSVPATVSSAKGTSQEVDQLPKLIAEIEELKRRLDDMEER
jgi:hypothetical protein